MLREYIERQIISVNFIPRMSAVDVKISAMKANGASARERLKKINPFDLFAKHLRDKYEARPPTKKLEWREMISESKSWTVKELKSEGWKAKAITRAIYENSAKSEAYKSLVDEVPKSVEALNTVLSFSAELAAKEHDAADQAAPMVYELPKVLRKPRFALKKSATTQHAQRREKVVSMIRGDWEHLQGELDKLGADAPPELVKESERVGLELFELETGIDFSGATAEQKSLISKVLEKAEGVAHIAALSGTPRNYLGGHLGGWESLYRGVPPTDELDEIAKKHDAAFLAASLVKDKEARKAKLRAADEAMVKEIDDMMLELNLKAIPADQQAKVDALKDDAEKAKTAIQAKMGMDSAGLAPSDWATAGVRAMTTAELTTKAKKIAASYADYVEKAEAHVKDAPPGAPQIKLPPGSSAEFRKISEAIGGYFDPRPSRAGALPEEKDEPEVGAAADPAADPVSSEPSAEVKPEEGAGKVQKVSMDLGSILDELKEMNRGTRNPKDIFSLKPITGERNMRPMLVKGDVEGILARKPAEVVDNMDFYANWKFIQPGWSNGNQQLLPGQIGVPFRNTLLRAQWENQDYQFMDNFDVGARDWYDKTYMPHRRRDMTAHSKRMSHKFRVPMIRDTQTHQLPTRNGALPAGVGRPIHFATETSNGFDIYTPTQRLDARQTRLFNGDVVDGRRV